MIRMRAGELVDDYAVYPSPDGSLSYEVELFGLNIPRRWWLGQFSTEKQADECGRVMIGTKIQVPSTE